jgi:G patch domain/KOW motif-containing protein
MAEGSAVGDAEGEAATQREAGGVKVAFGFSKTTRRGRAGEPAPHAVAHDEHEDEGATADADGPKRISEFDGTRAGDGPVQELVIPLVRVNQWRAAVVGDQPGSGPAEAGGEGKAEADLDAQAARALVAEAQQLADGSTEAPPLEAIPLLMQNRPPGTEAVQDDKAKFLTDVEQRPPESTLDDYERVPISHFGEAMLRGMGWSKGTAIGGTFKGLVEPIEFVPRASGLGLGATLNVDLMRSDKKRRLQKDKRFIKPGETRSTETVVGSKVDADGRVRHVKGLSEELHEQEDLRLQRGARVRLLRGVHAGQVGKITRLFNLMLDVKLGLSEAVVAVDESDVEVIAKSDYATRLKALRDGGGSSAPTAPGNGKRRDRDGDAEAGTGSGKDAAPTPKQPAAALGSSRRSAQVSA